MVWSHLLPQEEQVKVGPLRHTDRQTHTHTHTHTLGAKTCQVACVTESVPSKAKNRINMFKRQTLPPMIK